MKKKIIITLHNAPNTDASAFCSKITVEGAKIEKVFPFGVITAVVEQELIEKLKLFTEVEDVHIDEPFELPPPSAPIQ